jgi:replicative DNA helicase
MISAPNDIDAEKAVLGSILIDGGGCALRSAMNILQPIMFYQDKHRTIYEAMVKMGPDVPVDAITLADNLAVDVADIGGKGYLVELLGTVGHAANLRHYAFIVARLYWERQINQECSRLVECKDPSNIETLAATVRSRDSVGRDKTESIGDVLHRAIENHGKKKARELYTVGYKTLDELWGGCLPGEITTWAAAPGVGKSLLMVNIMRHCAEHKWRCLMVGTEMSNTEQSDRIMSVFGGPAAFYLRRGIPAGQWHKYIDTAAMLADTGISLMDNPEPTLGDIENAIIESKPKIVFVDYLTHCSLPSLSKADPMRLRIKEFMIRLHSIARRHEVVVHLTSQLNRTAYAGQAEVAPTMGLLAESSSVEQESSRVVLVWEPPVQEAEQRPDVRFLQAINCKSRDSRRKKNVCLFLDENSLRIQEAYASS